VIGEREFYGRSFLVDRRVLVPRPETEILIEAALQVLEQRHEGVPKGVPAPALVVDVGTGSGAIACTLALEAPAARVVACDVSVDALVVAAANRDRLGLGQRLALVRGGLLSWLREPADLVVANLPYIPAARVPTLMPEVALWEPHLALDGGDDGLDLVRVLLADAPRIVRPGGTILLELDPEQMAPARVLLPDARATVIPDLAGLDRVLRLELP
jgi:release factor glutamine methyltransferase